jgi:hypothetical protein
MKKIHIFYSHHNVKKTDNKNRPGWFDYEKCFLNLLNTISNEQNIKLNVMMDGKIDLNWISKYKNLYKYYEFDGGNMDTVTKKVYSFIKDYECDNEDLIYVLENDYLHVNNWYSKINAAFTDLGGLAYVSLYDHADKYYDPIYYRLVSQLVVTSNHHWRTTPSTCGSYVTKKSIFLEDFDEHTGINIPIGDHHKWLYLNKTKNRIMLTPVPGLSTHCMKGLLSPTIDWQKINDFSYNTNV